MFFTGIDSQLGKTSESSKSTKNKILINQKFLMKRIIERRQNYNLYEGVDIIQQQFVNVYIKPLSQQNFYSKLIKEQLKNRLSPPVIWTGTHRIEKYIYMVQVHQKYGPTLKSMFSHINQHISDKDFIHLFYQMIKLVQKISNGGYVHRQLSPSNIVFDPSPQRNQLYILDTFNLKKKNQQCPKLMTKYCSKGSHLGLNANIKDDLESLCYIMLDIYSSGNFLRNQSPSEYENAKSILQPKSNCQNLPGIFLDFYYYVVGMNYTDEINCFHWKNAALKTLPKSWIAKPYSWMLVQKKNHKKQDNIYQSDSEHIETEQASFILNGQNEKIQFKVCKFALESKVNSMKSKLKIT